MKYHSISDYEPKDFDAISMISTKDPFEVLEDINAVLDDNRKSRECLVWHRTPQGPDFWQSVYSDGHNKASLKWLREMRAALVTAYPQTQGI